jgi:hypothetical protein
VPELVFRASWLSFTTGSSDGSLLAGRGSLAGMGADLGASFVTDGPLLFEPKHMGLVRYG